MNATRRNELANAVNLINAGGLDGAKDAVETALSEEQEYFDNMPEGLQNGSRGEAAQSAISALESAIAFLEDGQGDEAAEAIDEASA